MKKSVLVFFIMMVAVLLFCSACGYQAAAVISESDALTWWCPNRYAHVGNMGDSAVYQTLMTQTDVDVAFIHPPQGEHRERFLSLLSGQALPDIITHDFINDYPGGAEKALNDGIIVPLNNMIDTYCPNLKAYLEANPDIKEMISTRDGRIFCFPSVQADRQIRTYMGPFIRQDLLDCIGMQKPVTVDEWYQVLSAFKSEMNITPLTFYGGKILDTDFLIGAYGLSWDIYVADGVVKFGPLENGFKDFMQEFKRWYDEGLISSGIFTDSQKTYQAKAQRGDVGIYVDYITSMETYQSVIQGAVMTPLTYPVLAHGDAAFSGHIAPVFVPYASCYVSKDNKDIEASAKLLDYAYSKDGRLLFNFGIEGESYTLIDGEACYTQDILGNEDGFTTAIKRYLASGAYVRDPRQFEQMLVLDAQTEAVELWSKTEAEQHLMPCVVLSAEQAETVADFYSGYTDVLIKWLKDYCLSTAGTTSVPALRDTLNDMGAQHVIAIYQEVLNEAG